MFTNTLRFDHCIGEPKIVERATSSWKTFQFLTFQFHWMTNFGCILHLFAYFDLFRCLTDFFVALWQLFWKSDLFYVKVSHATNPLQAGQRQWVEFCGRESSGHLEAGVIQLHNFETLRGMDGGGARSCLQGSKINRVCDDFACRSEKPSTSKCLNWTGWWH